MEYANICVECQKRHLKEVKKSSFDIICSGIPKKLWEENHFPLEEIIDKETYFSLTEDEIVGLQYKYNKALWAKDCINWSTFNEKRNFEQFYQKELLLCTAKRKVGRLGRRMGKCLAENSLILTKEKGLIPVSKLNNNLSLMTFDENLKDFKWTKKWTKWENGIKPTFKLQTRLGNIDYVTDNHPYYKFTENGLEWVEVKDLKIGDRIVAAKSYEKLYNEKSKDENYEKEYYKLLGYLISDGVTNYKNNVRFTNFDAKIVLDIKRNVKIFGSKLKRYSKGQYSIIHNKLKQNVVQSIVDREEINSLAINKKLPISIWSTNNYNVAAFIGSAFDCDGWITEDEIGYCSSSYSLANGIKHLLKRFGMNFNMKKKKVMYNGEYKYTYQITTQNLEQMKIFYQNIILIQKQQKIKDNIENKSKNQTGINWLSILPKEINSIIKEETALKGYKSFAKLEKEVGARIKSCYSPTINKVNKFNSILKNDFIDFVSNGNIIFDEIKSIEPSKECMTYDINVPGTNNFITNDLLTHNSEVLSVDALHFACNNPGKTVMILTPFQNTADELYDRMCGLLESEFSIYRANFKKKAKPNKITIFIDGKKSVIKMFTTGTKSGSEGASTRGQKADRIYFDETAYFTNKDIETVYALALESEDVEIIAFSTPTALKTLYRQWCQSEPNWRDFHFPSTILPNWENVKKEMERTYDEQGFAQEILAEFFESSGKVFMTDAINAALRDYKYTEKLEDVENFEQYICTMGVDWNEWKNGRMYAVLCGDT